MYKVEDFFGTFSLLRLIILVLIIVVFYHWRKDLYYYASKFPWPFSSPLIGIAHRFSLTHENFETMYKVEDFFGTSFLLRLIILVLIIVVSYYHWKRKHLYYYASKIPGPFSFPLIGIGHRFYLTHEIYFNILLNIIKENPQVFKFWVGPYLFVSTTRPQDVDIILNTFLEKGSSYKFVFDQVRNSIFTAPVNMWKKTRKFINHTFNLAVINSLQDIFVNNSRHLVKTLEKTCGENETDLLMKVWTGTLNSGFETLYDMDPADVDLYKMIPWAVRAEQTTVERHHKLWLQLDPIWKLTAAGRETNAISSEVNKFMSKVIEMKQKTLDNVDLKNCDITKKFRFLNYLVDNLLKNGHMNFNQILKESTAMLIGGTETTAITITSVILILGMYPDIQDKVYQEIISVTDNNMDITLRDVRGFEYVQRVIKETMRLFPVFPLISRSIDRDLHLDSFTIPSGCDVLIPIIQIHRDPDLWPDPLKFDPDRFLPEEIEKRHRCAYIPLSFGTRNCIGGLYAVNQMKCFVVHIVKNLKIKTLNWKSINDFELDYHMMFKPINYNIVMEKRRQD